MFFYALWPSITLKSDWLLKVGVTHMTIRMCLKYVLHGITDIKDTRMKNGLLTMRTGYQCKAHIVLDNAFRLYDSSRVTDTSKTEYLFNIVHNFLTIFFVSRTFLSPFFGHIVSVVLLNILRILAFLFNSFILNISCDNFNQHDYLTHYIKFYELQFLFFHFVINV